MKHPTPTDTRYIPLTQQEYCCVPTCIQMIMLRNHIPLIAAELIGYHLGLVVSDDTAHLFYQPRTGERPRAGYGTQIYKPEYSPNTMFNNLNIPLNLSLKLIDQFPTLDHFTNYLQQLQDTVFDILVCYDWPTLFDPTRTEHWGHVCVLDTIDIQNHQVRIIDPSPRSPKWINISIDKLYTAMLFHTQDKSGGFWELNRDLTNISIGFAQDLVPLVKNGFKTLTYRLGNKYTFLQVGDIVAVNDSSTEDNFAQIEIIEKGYTTFVSLPIDRPGHEVYENKQQQRDTFQKYYGEIKDEDKILILGFKVIT